MASKRYIKIMINDSIKPSGSYSADLIDPVAKKLGKPITIQRISAHLHEMFVSDEVSRETETKSGCYVRHKWFRNDQ